MGQPKMLYYDMGKLSGPWWVAAVEAAVYHAVGPTLDTVEKKIGRNKYSVYCGGPLHAVSANNLT